MGRKLTESFKLQAKATRRKVKADEQAKQIPNFKNLDIPYIYEKVPKEISLEVIDILAKTDKRYETHVNGIEPTGQTFMISSIICPICNREVFLNKHWNCYICDPAEHDKAVFDIKKVVNIERE